MEENIAMRFAQYLENEKHVADNTRTSYISDMNQFVRYIGQKNIELMAVTEDDIKDYIKYQTNIGKANSTLSRIVAALKCFYGFLYRKGELDLNPAADIVLERHKRKLPQVLTGGEMESFLDQVSDSDYKGMRDRAMLELLYATGIRVSELVSLNLSDISMEAKSLAIKGKSGVRVIPIYDSAVNILQRYVDKARPYMVSYNDSEPALFLNVNGTRMSRQGFWKIVKNYAEKIGLTKDITPHTLRHSFAAHLLENGADLRSLKEMLGHADISSTLVYRKLLDNQISEVYHRTHPKA